MENRGRQFFYVIAGGYLLYLAYKLFSTTPSQGGTNPVVVLIFSILFGIAGISILVFAFFMYRNASRQEPEVKSEEILKEETVEENTNEMNESKESE